MYEKFGQFIDGKWQQSSDKSTYEVINPANEEIIGNASKARNILLAGMDGYQKNDPNNSIMQDLFDEYDYYNLRNIYAITPTKYNIKKKYII